MHRGSTTSLSATFGWRPSLLASLAALAFVLPTLAPAPAAAETTWLCKPGLAENPCEASEETTVELGNGSTHVEQSEPASNPPIDCFYVYPTVSSQSTENSNLEVETTEKQVAIDQASRFSQHCKVYAPMYEQLTLHAIEHPEDITAGDQLTAYLGVVSAFEEYLSKYNQGRGFVLIGHSQGAILLKSLIKEKIDRDAAVRHQLVSALLFGGNVLVPKGGTVGAEFQNIPACESAGQTHCVVAYSSFLSTPPEGAYFGRVASPLLGPTTSEESEKDEVLCVNPGLSTQGPGAAPLLRYESTTQIPGFPFPVPSAPTPWVSMPEQYSGQCLHEDGASWLQLSDIGPGGDPRETVSEELGPLWGTHLNDVNIALGNLVAMTGLQAATYEAEQLAPESPPPATPSAPAAATSTAPAAAPTSVTPASTHASTTSRKRCKRTVVRGRKGKKGKLVCVKPKPKRKHKRRASKRKRPTGKSKR